jgi:hypothetical protein
MAEIKSIIESNLKECLNDCVFNPLITNKSIPFISSTSKKSIKSYLKIDNLDNSKELWKNLLIDSICILKVNDKRERIYKDSKENITLFNEHFENIRKSSSYGINEIGDYFDDFIEFESVLYGTDKHYRDHVKHVLQVWAIGIGLINNNEIVFKDGYLAKKNLDFHFQIDLEKELKSVNEDDLSTRNLLSKEPFISKSELWAMWTIIALCHDLGYPIEKTSEINKQAKKIISHFGNMNFSELNYSFDIFNSFLVDKFLNIISSKAEIELKETSIQSKFRDKISKSLEDYKHGVFSSLLIFKNLTYFLETDYSSVQKKLSDEDLRQFHIRKEILRAIASHTCPKVYHLEFNTLSFLLILCDELQEWNRPKFNELRDNAHSQAPESVELKKYDMGEAQSIHIEFIYDFDYNDKFGEYFVFKKFKNIHNLLRSAKDDNMRKIIFDWDILFKDKKYSLSFDSRRNSFEFMKVSEHKFENDSWVLQTADLSIY